MAPLFPKTLSGDRPNVGDNAKANTTTGSYNKLRTSDVDFGIVDSDSSSHLTDVGVSLSGLPDENTGYIKQPTNMKGTMMRLVQMARPERHLMICSSISMTFSSAVSLAVPTYSGRIIDLSISNMGATETGLASSSSSSSSSPFQLLMSLLGIMTLAGIAGFFRIWWQAQAGHRLVARLRRNLYVGILSQDASYFDSIQQGDLISRLSSDADLVQSAVTDQALGLLRNVVVAVGAVAMLFYTSISLALVSVAVLPPIAVCARLVGRQMRDRQKKVRELHAEATSLAEQSLTCIRTVQQYVAESYESEQYNRAINQAHLEGIYNTKLQAMFGSVMQLVVNLALLCVLGFGGIQVQKGELTPGDLTGFVMYSVLMGSNISSISTLYIDLMKAIAAADRVFEIIDRVPPIPPPMIMESAENEILGEIAGTKMNDFVNKHSMGGVMNRTKTSRPSALEMMELGDRDESNSLSKSPPFVVPMSVQFDNVTFCYPTRSETKVLNNLTLNIKAGQVVALVGGSGAGKSTIASLLTRLYDPQSGDIRIDNVALRDRDPQDVRRNVGVVVQEPLLFPTTIEANIRYGSPNATDEQVREAARLAFVLDFADKFPDGLATVVGPRGTQLSGTFVGRGSLEYLLCTEMKILSSPCFCCFRFDIGGQKQRCAVARCILKNPPIVVFDEATSALDAESESQVQMAIDTACKGRTVIMIAHRLSTIRNADSIIVVRNGQVAETGSFDLLMEDPTGSFRQLMEKQLVQ
jgi:ABC-type multidrug transport system fused ATPase/permease subunit